MFSKIILFGSKNFKKYSRNIPTMSNQFIIIHFAESFENDLNIRKHYFRNNISFFIDLVTIDFSTLRNYACSSEANVSESQGDSEDMFITYT